MDKILNKKYIFILIIAFVMSFSIGFFTTNTGLNEEANAGAQDPNYDKLRVSFVTIDSRKTGTAPFDTVPSDMDGHDYSEDDNYVRTFDKITYILEVGIERNEATTSATDVLKGGKIKVKATIPSNNGVYIGFVKDNWMQSYKYNDTTTEITAYYNIPTSKPSIGGTQQLSFTIATAGYEKELTPDMMPTFEVWMEGNKPDNSESAIDSKSITDTDPLIITGRINHYFSMYAGRINNAGELNGVKGQYINFYTFISSETAKGTENPVNHLSSTLELKYSYRDLDSGNTGLIDLATISGVDPINGTILYSYGRPCETTEGFWPDSEKNVPDDKDYCARSEYKSASYMYLIDSGDMTASQDGVNITFENNNFYSYSTFDNFWKKKIAADGFELFVPWYEPEPGHRYEYQLIVKDTSITLEDSSGPLEPIPKNSTLNFAFYNTLSGNFSFGLSAYGYTHDLNGKNPIYQTDYTDMKSIPLNRLRYYYSTISANDGPYEGGLERLVVWNSESVELSTAKDPYIEYSNNGINDTPSVQDATIKYGIYKDNPSKGVLTDDDVNSADFNDFDWYDSISEAKNNGKITAIRTDEPTWNGNKITSTAYVYLNPINDISVVGNEGIIRHKIIVYTDEDRFDKKYIGFDNDYVKAVINEQGTGLSSSAREMRLGEGFFITGISLSIEENTVKSNYNVEEELAGIIIKPGFSSGIDDSNGKADFKVWMEVPTELTYHPNSSNYEPTSVVNNDNGTQTVTWEFNDWYLADPLPEIRLWLEMSPYIQNNTSKAIYVYISSPAVKTGNKQNNRSLSITNLAGSSLRKNIEKEYLELGDQTNITDYLYNIAQRRLVDVKTVEILPKNGDTVGSTFSGSYTIKVIDLLDDQKMYYSTNPVDNIGLAPDTVGKLNIKNVDLDNDPRWIEVHEGDTIPSNATAIATYIPEVAAVSDINFKTQFIPSGNTYLDKYYFQVTASSSNLDNAFSSEYKSIGIVDRKISGIVFADKNGNNKYDSGTDTLLPNKKVYLVNSSDQVISEMTTDTNGHYEGEHFERGTYYIKYNLGDGEEFITKNAASSTVSSVINTDGKSDVIEEFSQNPTNVLVHAENKNVGIKYKEAQIVVHHYVKNTITKVHDDVYLTDKTYYINDSYTTSEIASSDLYDDYKNNYHSIEFTDGAPKSGTVNSELVEVIYYYEPTPATITTHHYLVGTTTSVFDDVVTTVEYGSIYSTSRIESLEYADAGHTGDDVSGTVSRPSYEVIYYYAIRKATITTHHYKVGTTTKVHDDDIEEKDFNAEYSTHSYATTDLFSDFQGKYFYTNNHSGDNTEGTVNKNVYDIIYYYDVKPANILVHHYLLNTIEKVHEDVRLTVNYGESYQTHYLETNELAPDYQNRYYYNSTGGDPITGVVNQDNYEVIYYYGIQNAVITVHHYLEGTTTKVHEDDTISKMFFERYETTAYNPGDLDSPYTDKYYYNNKNGGDARSGNVGKTRYEIIYYYELRDAEIITNYYKFGTEDKVQDSKVMYKKIYENYNTRPLETEELYNRYRNVYIYANSSSGDPTSGVVDKVRYVVNYFYVPRESTITVHHYEINKDGVRTTNKVHADVVTPKNFLDSYSTMPLESSQLDGNYKNNYYYNNVHVGETTGTVGTDNIEVIYYYEAKPSRVVVHHFVEGTSTKVHADDVYNKVYTDTYETRPFNPEDLIGIYQNNYYYHNHHTGDELSGVINKDNYEITYYYELRPSVITVHHYLTGTTTKVHNDDTIDKLYTNEYEIVPYDPSELTGTYKNNYYYNGEHSGDSLTGYIDKDNYDIVIYYEQRPSVITVHHYLTQTITKVHEDDVINKYYGDPYETSSYSTGELDNPYKNVYSFNSATSGDEVSGTVNKGNYEIIYYYDFRPSVVTVHHYIKGTTTKVHEDDVLNKKFMDIYQTSPYNTSLLEGDYANWYEYSGMASGDQPNGTIIGESYEVTYYYDKRDARITVHHYIKDTETKLAEDEIIDLKLRDHYETSSKEGTLLNKPNYIFDSVVGEASGTINDLEMEIVYYYKLKDAKLIVHFIAEDTNEKLCDDIISDVTYQDAYTTDSCTTLSNINYAYKNLVTNDSNSEQRGMRTIGNILQDVVEVTYYYELKPGQIVVHYFEVNTRNRIADDIVVDGLASKEYVSEAKDIEGFTLVHKPESNVHYFEENTKEVIYEYQRNTYNVNVSVTGGVGDVTGSEEVLYDNDSKEGYITIKPSEGYVIDKVIVDGEEIEITNNKDMVLDNFKKVNKDHSIEVLFTEEEIPVPITGMSNKIIVIALIILSLGIMYLAVNNGFKKKIN